MPQRQNKHKADELGVLFTFYSLHLCKLIVDKKKKNIPNIFKDPI